MKSLQSVREVAILRAALIGMGVMGRHHARVLSSLAGVELVTVVDPAVDALPGNDLLVTSRLDDLTDLDLDYVVVATPTSQHLEAANFVASLGVPMLIEKPLAGSSTEAKEIVRVFESLSLLASVGHIERFNPAVMEARKRIDDGQLGRILQISTRRVGPYPVRIKDASIAHDFAIHDIDLACWLSKGMVKSVSAAGKSRAGSDRLDSLAITSTSDHGIVFNHVVNWISPYLDRTVVITGEHGVFEIDTQSATLTYKAGAGFDPIMDDLPYFHTVQVGDVVTYAIDRREPLLVEHEAFRDAVLGVTEGSHVPLRQALHAVAVADAALGSAAAGGSVKAVETPK